MTKISFRNVPVWKTPASTPTASSTASAQQLGKKEETQNLGTRGERSEEWFPRKDPQSFQGGEATDGTHRGRSKCPGSQRSHQEPEGNRAIPSLFWGEISSPELYIWFEVRIKVHSQKGRFSNMEHPLLSPSRNYRRRWSTKTRK